MPASNPLIHSRELELAARDHATSYKPDYDLASRVESYTNWDGEINEIVHYSKATAKGIDVLMNMAISDYIGDTKNIETMFGPNYRFFGVRVNAHDLYDYCVVIIYAEEIYSTVKTALFTSSNIDNEIREERETLARNIAQKSAYRYQSRFARENPNVQKHDHLDKSRKSLRKVRLNQNDDGGRTLTVFRRDSLERNTEYVPHDDTDYLYSDRRNERFSRASYFGKEKPNKLSLGRGEKIYRRTITDYDNEIYSKNIGPSNERVTVHAPGEADPYSQRYTVESHRDIDDGLYYADPYKVKRLEETIVSNYPTVSPELKYGKSSRKSRTRESTYEKDMNSDNVTTFRTTAHTPRKKHNRRIYADTVDDSEASGYYSSQNSKTISNIPKDDGIEVVYTEEPIYDREITFRTPKYPTNYARKSVVNDMAAVVEEPTVRRHTTYTEHQPRVVSNYQMVEREATRASSPNRPSLTPIIGGGVTSIKPSYHDQRATNDRFNDDVYKLHELDLSDSY